MPVNIYQISRRNSLFHNLTIFFFSTACAWAASKGINDLFTYLLTKLSPSWGAASSAASTLWNPKVNYCAHKSPQLVPILSHINPVHNIPFYISKIHFNIVHPPTSWSYQWSLSFWLSHQYPICILLLNHSCYMSRPSHPPRLHNFNYTWRRVQVMKLLIMQFSPTSCHFISLRSNLFSNILSLRSSLNVRDQVSHPYKATGRIIIF
jgi:hypothetical protein